MYNGRRIFITGCGLISSLGAELQEAAVSYRLAQEPFSYVESGNRHFAVGRISEGAETRLALLLEEEPYYQRLDRVTQLAIFAARGCVNQAGWAQLSNCSVHVGSSRGATATFEASHQQFLNSSSGRVPPLTSPTTTLGNISSWIAQDLAANGLALSHSVTCSTSLHSFVSGIAWLLSGFSERCIVGGSEAPLTGYTLAQMDSLRIYAPCNGEAFPCRPLEQTITPINRMVLGEGAACFALEVAEDYIPDSALAEITAFGIAQEKIAHMTDLDPGGSGFGEAMSQCLKAQPEDTQLDAIITHAPGTRRGDAAEMTAINELFSEAALTKHGPPLLCSTKFLTGHTLGASGALSVAYALHLLNGGPLAIPPYPTYLRTTQHHSNVSTILVNAAGFGGNIVSLALRAVETNKGPN